MAIAFELVADFGSDKHAAEDCLQWLAARISPVHIGEYPISIHPPFVNGYPYANPTNFKLSVVPANVGYYVGIDNGERIPLNDTQLSYLGSRLYDLLRGAPHFELAMVGWDVDCLLDIDFLNTDWATELASGMFPGLVVKTALISQLPPSSHFVHFDDEHLWIPYAGSKSL